MTAMKTNFIIKSVLISNLVAFSFLSCPENQSDNRISETPDQFVKRGNFTQSDSLPIIVVKGGETKNLGSIKEGIKTSVIFTLKNIGITRAIGISVHDLSRGGCTAVSKVSEIAPGDSASLEFIFETLGYGGKKQNRKIKVRYNNPELSPITLSVTAEVLPTEPYQVPIGELFYNFFVLIDIRDRQKFQQGHIIGAINVPVNELEAWISQLPDGFLIYLYSDSGEISDQYTKILRAKGYSRALSIVGGLAEWKDRYGDRNIIKGNR
jgi:rhodanese-related sulfurtransferase